MNTIIVNGKSYSTNGKNISVVNGNVSVDGDLIVGGLKGDVHVKFEGDLAKLDCNTAEIYGNVHGKVDANKVTCMEIHKNVDANTVKVGVVRGNVDANTVKGLK